MDGWTDDRWTEAWNPSDRRMQKKKNPVYFVSLFTQLQQSEVKEEERDAGGRE